MLVVRRRLQDSPAPSWIAPSIAKPGSGQAIIAAAYRGPRPKSPLLQDGVFFSLNAPDLVVAGGHGPFGDLLKMRAIIVCMSSQQARSHVFRITTTFCTSHDLVRVELDAERVLADSVDARHAVDVVLFGSAEVDDAFDGPHDEACRNTAAIASSN
jgi:hypothetical protein